MGHQFLHVYSYSQAGKHTVAGCLGEAFREEGYTHHIEKPEPPQWLHGSRAGLDGALHTYQTEYKDSRGHRLRKDGQVLRADVVSWPPDMPEAERLQAEALTVKFYQAKYGTAFRGALRHVDEPFRDSKFKGDTHHHLHLFIVPEASQNFQEVHPGLKAKRAADKANKNSREEKGQAKARGNIAYKKAMGELQDEFQKEVGQKFSLTRTGPRAARISQKEQSILHQAKNEAGKMLSTAEKKAAEITARAENEAVSIYQTAERQQEAADKREAEAVQKNKALDKREKELDGRERTMNEGLNTTLKKWGLPGYAPAECKKIPLIGEVFTVDYLNRVYDWAYGWVKQVSKLITENTAKQKELDQKLARQDALTNQVELSLDRLNGKYGQAKQFEEWKTLQDAQRRQRGPEQERGWSR